MCWSKAGHRQLKDEDERREEEQARRLEAAAGEAGRADAPQEKEGSARARPKRSAGDLLARWGGWRPTEITPSARVR